MKLKNKKISLIEIYNPDGSRKKQLVLAVEGNYYYNGEYDIEWTKERLQQYYNNYQKNVYGQRIPITVVHDDNNPEGAAGWLGPAELKEVEWGDGSMRLGFVVTPEWTDYGVMLVENRRFIYLSLEFWDKWFDAETRETTEDVITGVTLTNRPHIKRQPEVKLNEKMMTVMADMDVKDVIEGCKNRMPDMKSDELMDLMDSAGESLIGMMKGKKGVPMARAQKDMLKKHLDMMNEAYKSQSDLNNGKEVKNMADEATVTKLNEEMENMKKQLVEMQAKEKRAQETEKQLAETQKKLRENLVESKADYLVQKDIIKPGMRADALPVFLSLATRSDQFRQLSEGKDAPDLLNDVVTLMEKCCYKHTLPDGVKGTSAEAEKPEPEKKDEKNLSEVEKIKNYAAEHKLSYMEATHKLREQGKIDSDIPSKKPVVRKTA